MMNTAIECLTIIDALLSKAAAAPRAVDEKDLVRHVQMLLELHQSILFGERFDHTGEIAQVLVDGALYDVE